MEYSKRVTAACYSEFRRVNLPPGSLLFTSALTDEGKTFIAIELAMAGAMRAGEDKPILFVDMNSYNREGSLILQQEEQLPGLVNLLAGESDLEACVHETKIPGLFMMPYGEASESFEPLQHLQGLEKAIKKLGEKYRLMIDSGPVFLRNRRNFDPVEIARMVDAVILVILSGKTPREIVLNCQKEIRNYEGNLAGVIMNDRFVRPFRSELSFYLSLLEKIPLVRSPIRYVRARLGIY